MGYLLALVTGLHLNRAPHYILHSGNLNHHYQKIGRTVRHFQIVHPPREVRVHPLRHLHLQTNYSHHYYFQISNHHPWRLRQTSQYQMSAKDFRTMVHLTTARMILVSQELSHPLEKEIPFLQEGILELVS